LFCGYLPWLLFQDTVQRAASSLLDQSNLITKTLFPSEIIPVTLFLSSLASHAIAVGVAVIMVRYITGQFSVTLIVLPVYTLLLGLFAVGISWIVSSLHVFLRDTAQMVIVLLTGWFWATPIFLDESNFPDGAKFLVKYNPLALVVRGYRQRLMTGELPHVGDLLMLAAISLSVFVLGGMVFRHLKRGFADVL
ncbi:MAG: ABC transporter permease, partial [Acidobacteria bacterium]|nr:ABC transporter permease [Acidobacteriota bacterium]